MSLRRSDEHTRILRQRIVSSCRCRGMNSEETQTFLAEKGVINPRTQSPFSLGTINGDLKEIEARWMDEMMMNISFHRSRVLAELRETKAAAWKAGQLSIVLRSIDQEVALLGLNELERMGVEIALANLFRGFPKEVADQLKEILAKKVSDNKRVDKGKKLIQLRAV